MHTALASYREMKGPCQERYTVHMDELEQRAREAVPWRGDLCYAPPVIERVSSECSACEAGTNFSWSGVSSRRAKFIMISKWEWVFPPVQWSPQSR